MASSLLSRAFVGLRSICSAGFVPPVGSVTGFQGLSSSIIMTVDPVDYVVHGAPAPNLPQDSPRVPYPVGPLPLPPLIPSTHPHEVRPLSAVHHHVSAVTRTFLTVPRNPLRPVQKFRGKKKPSRSRSNCTPPILIPPPPPPHPPPFPIPHPPPNPSPNPNPICKEATISITRPYDMTAGGAVERHHGPPPAAEVRKPAPGQPWSHLETVHLIEAYEEKWYSLKRGQLKAQQWEEVAAAVAARCGFDGLSKTGTQCRHKIEKLRKRYRAERLRPNTSAWPFFDRMDRMERGPLPISVRLPAPPTSAAGGGGPSSEEEEEEDDDEDDEEEERIASNTRSISGILREGNWGFSRVSRNSTSKKRRSFEEEEEDDDGDEEEEEGEGGRGEALSQLAVVVRRFGEELVRMEKKRMEMLRDVERDWMVMEAKRAEMVMESQRCLVDTIANAFISLKKAKKSQDL